MSRRRWARVVGSAMEGPYSRPRSTRSLIAEVVVLIALWYIIAGLAKLITT